MILSTTVVATVRVHGTHCWPKAPDAVGYLRMPHRHEFVFRVGVDVRHDDRDVEFHLLQEMVNEEIAEEFHTDGVGAPWGYAFGNNSCEALAILIGTRLKEQRGVNVEFVEVWEDDENGARVKFRVSV